MIEFSCTNCGERIVVTDEYAGKRGKCRKCGGVNVVPNVRAESSSSGDGSPLRQPSPTGQAAAATEGDAPYKLAERTSECPRCKGEVPKTAKECPHCGMVLAGASGQAPAVAAEVSGYGGYQAAPPYEFYYAGFWRRFAAAFIDSIVLTVGGFVIGGIAGVAVGAILGSMGVELSEITAVCRMLGRILGLTLCWLYFTLFECSSRQATLGKMALGIVVTDMQGGRISFGRANGRHWGKIVSVLTLWIGFLMAGFTEKKQALHDIMASCLVIKT